MIFNNSDVTLTKFGALCVPITQEMYDWAAPRADDIGRLRNSIRQGSGNICGMLGEAALLKGLPGTQSLNTFQHDVQYDEITLEVKSKDRTVVPDMTFEASVANYNPNQKADCYVFTSLLRDKSTGRYTHCYLMGMIDKHRYFKDATFLRKGDIVDTNNFVVRANCYNLPYSQLIGMDFLSEVYSVA